MSQQTVTKCDNCNVLKVGDGNGWYTLRIGQNPFFLVIGHLGTPGLLIDMKIKNVTFEILDACGETCTIEKVSKILGASNVGHNKQPNETIKTEEPEREFDQYGLPTWSKSDNA